MKQEKGNWPPVDVKNIVASVKRVFEKRDINQLSKKAYHFITLQMGFIAHYDRNGFCSVYSDLAVFAHFLLTSEYSPSRNLTRNRNDADRYEKQQCFIDDYGIAYCKSRTQAMLGIVELAKKWLPILKTEKAEAVKTAELSRLSELADKHSYSLAKS